jgi:hypothetical protein
VPNGHHLLITFGFLGLGPFLFFLRQRRKRFAARSKRWAVSPPISEALAFHALEGVGGAGGVVNA